MAKQSKAKKLTPGVPAQGGAQTAKKPRGSGAVKLALMLVLLVALVAGVIAGSTTWATATARAETAGKAIDKILNGSNRALSILQRQRYLRLNLISRIFRTDQVLTSYLVAAAQARDEAAILASVEEYQDLLTFDLAVVLDRNGVVLTRTDDRSASGEDLAATPLVAVALEESKASGVWQQNDQLYNALAEPLVRQFELVGYIAVAYSINNTLAADIKRTGGAEIVFLAESGVGPAPVASTLDDGMSQELVEALRKQGDVLGLVMEEGDVVDRVELEFGGEKWTASLAPLRDAAGGSVGAAIALTSLGDTRQSFNNIQKATLVAGGLSLLVGAILAFALAKWVYRPFTRLADAVTQGVQGHWDVQMPTGSGDAKRISEAVRDLFTQLRETAGCLGCCPNPRKRALKAWLRPSIFVWSGLRCAATPILRSATTPRRIWPVWIVTSKRFPPPRAPKKVRWCRCSGIEFCSASKVSIAPGGPCARPPRSCSPCRNGTACSTNPARRWLPFLVAR